MTLPDTFGEIRLEATTARNQPQLVPDSGMAFCIALLGDFSGRGNRRAIETGPNLASRSIVAIDRDNFDEVLAKVQPEIHLPFGNESGPLKLRFSSLDDFHPDQLYGRTEVFQRLREVRARLQDPATFPAAAEQLGITPLKQQTRAAESAVRTSISQLASGSLLDQTIEQTEAGVSELRVSRVPDELQEFVRRVTAPHLAAVADSRQAEVLAVIDRAVSGQMRALLHVPAFQALEAAWRALFFLVRRIETSTQLKIYLVDISKTEVAADLNSTEEPARTGLYRLLVEKSVGTPGAEAWAALAGNYRFGPAQEDADLLARLAQIASAAGAPFIAEASPRLLGCRSFDTTPDPEEWREAWDPQDQAAWARLRRLPEACAIGLVLPRFLLRLPYGKQTDPVDSFNFEEMLAAPAHEDYLWGNPAFAAVLVLAQSFSEEGWQMRPGMHSEIERLPLHVHRQDGEAALKPCSEALLTERAAERILESGYMPLVWLKDRDSVKLVRFQSIHERLCGLAARWSE